jgi:hypothetical protein
MKHVIAQTSFVHTDLSESDNNGGHDVGNSIYCFESQSCEHTQTNVALIKSK